jgi:hypothetical protein
VKFTEDDSGTLGAAPSTLLMMLQANVVVAGIAYVDLNTGFKAFLAVNLLANILLFLQHCYNN